MNIIFKLMRRILRKSYHLIFHNKIVIRELKETNEILKYQLEYMKRHCDIQQIKPATSWLREYQIKELDFALELIELFKQFDIHPFFDGGCLIGSVRHKGFVPWDDDVDMSVLRNDFDKIISIAKEKYVWVDYPHGGYNLFNKFCDESIMTNKNKYVFIRTPYCIHVYKGESLRNSTNCELFVYDYVKEGVTENEFKNYLITYKKKLDTSKPWQKIFDFYDKELDSEKYLTRRPTSRLSVGYGNWALTKMNFFGFFPVSDIFPLKIMNFENKSIPVPFLPESKLEKSYANFKAWPKDVGIAHGLRAINNYFIDNNIPPFLFEDI